MSDTLFVDWTRFSAVLFKSDKHDFFLTGRAIGGNQRHDMHEVLIFSDRNAFTLPVHSRDSRYKKNTSGHGKLARIAGSVEDMRGG